MPNKSIAIFGGTFDPVHHGHLIVARAVAEQRGLQQVTFVPSGRPPHKQPAHASGADRLAMLRLATEGEPLLAVSDVELRRPGPSYTYNTLLALREQWGPETELHLVIGSDMLADLPNWHRARDVVELARVVTVARPPWQRRTDELMAGVGRAFGRDAAERLSGSVVAVPLIDISSTEVRRRVAEGRSIRFLVPEPVREYVESRTLYTDPGN